MWQKGRIMAILIGLLVLCTGNFFVSSMAGEYNQTCKMEGMHTQVCSQYPAIMVTGYWDPTGKMIAPFSTNPYLNPGGWQGENWENQGYNIYSYFPTPGIYNGTLEVDYQDTWTDFWDITLQIHPVAIISFGAGDGPWEIEYSTRNLEFWMNDENPPYQPTPSPPDDTVPAGFIRHSTLPLQEIADAVNSQTDIEAWVDWDGFAGMYLCEYIGYLGMWYQSLHSGQGDLFPCRLAGLIHVDDDLSLPDVMMATNITIRETIRYLKETNTAPYAPHITGPDSGEAGTAYPYTFVATDPEGDNIYYMVSWGEGCTTTEWMGPYASGEEITLEYAWSQRGEYSISAIAKDIYDEESEPGILEVSMPIKENTGYLREVLEMIKDWLDTFHITIPLLNYVLNY